MESNGEKKNNYEQNFFSVRSVGTWGGWASYSRRTLNHMILYVPILIIYKVNPNYFVLATTIAK